MPLQAVSTLQPEFSSSAEATSRLTGLSSTSSTRGPVTSSGASGAKACGAGAGWAAVSALASEPRGEPEHQSVFRRAIHFDRAAHHLAKLLGDAKAQPGAPYRRVVEPSAARTPRRCGAVYRGEYRSRYR